MGFISTKCSNCGAKIEIDETIEKGICPYCGAEYVMEKPVNNTVNNMKIENAVFTVENKKITYKTITIGVEGWKIYQYGYDTSMGAQSNTSILELVSDPWLPYVYAGIYMMLAGGVLMFVMGGRR